MTPDTEKSMVLHEGIPLYSYIQTPPRKRPLLLKWAYQLMIGAHSTGRCTLQCFTECAQQVPE